MEEMVMMKSSVAGRNISENILQRYIVASAVIPLLAMLLALTLGGVLGTLDVSVSIFVVVGIVMTLVVVLRQNEIAVVLIAMGHLYIDWYLGLHLVALVMALFLLFALYVMRSASHPWVAPSTLWLWAVFLILSIFPAVRGALTLYDAANFYPGNVFGAFIMYWLGIIIARDVACVRRLFQLFAICGTLLAIHSILQATTGITLFESARISASLALVSDYQLLGSTAHRASSFFVNPDWNGAFFAMVVFLPLGLFIESSSLIKKCIYLIEMALIVTALLFTYSSGAWISMVGALMIFIPFIGYTRYRIMLPFLVTAIAIAMLIVFPSQIALQIQHANNPLDVSLRVGAWQTSIQVIKAFPLTGVGLGYQAYIQYAEPYRVPAQLIPLAHPHNSYLEWAAMAGLPVLLVFVALLSRNVWQAWNNWIAADIRTRSLLGAGIAAIATLSFNSLSVNVWTLPPLVAMGWLILGAIASPLLIKKYHGEEGMAK